MKISYMEIEIRQTQAFINDEFEIFIRGKHTYSAQTVSAAWKKQIEIYSPKTNQVKLLIEKEMSLLKPKYSIKTQKGALIPFRTVDFIQSHFQSKSGSSDYRIYGHTNRKYSVFLNNQQVAWWDKNPVAWMGKDRYRLITNSKGSNDLLIAFCLIIDHFYSRDDQGYLATIDFGRIGPEARAFDENWRPE